MKIVRFGFIALHPYTLTLLNPSFLTDNNTCWLSCWF